MSKDKTVKLELTPTDANALMVMIESEMETIFTYGSIDPINEWEQIDLYAYKLLAYQKYKTWYQYTQEERVKRDEDELAPYRTWNKENAE